MLPSSKRLLIGLALLYAGPLAQPGEAAPEPYPASLRGLDEAALARTPTGRPWVAEPYGSFSLELGDPPSSRQHQRVEDGSQASVKPDPPEQREPPVSETALVTLGGLPPYVVQDRPEVRYFVERFQTGYRRAVVERWLSRSGRYLEMIREIFAQRGLPEDLVFTAMIESGFDSVAVSRAGAGAIFEIAAWGLPSILIPLNNSAANHQRKNAYIYVKRGAAAIIEEKNLKPHIFLFEIEKLLRDEKKMEEMKIAARNFAKIGAAEKIARELMNMALKHAQ